MPVRFPGFAFVLSTSCLLSSACAAGAHVTGSAKAETAPALPAPGAPGGMPAPEPSRVSAEAAVLDAPVAPAPAAPPAEVAEPPADAAPRPSPSSPAATLAPRREMLDIEAHVTLRVPHVKRAVKSLHELAARLGGVVTSERVDSASRYGSAQLTLRVPSGAAPGALESLDALGKVTDQSVTARDIGKEYFDANLRLTSLETTLRRYQEILSHATKVEEILRIEQELGRLRAEIEQVKGNLRWLSDRAARATLHVNLTEERPEIVHVDEPEPEPKFFPGLRAVGLLDFDKKSEHGYVGGGLSIRASRGFSVDLDLLERLGADERGPDALIATLGGELFSDLLGGGERRYLNPYLGWRAGYAHFDRDHQALIGVTLGLELVKTRYFVLDAEARNYLIGGGDRGFHYGFTPALAAAVAF